MCLALSALCKLTCITALCCWTCSSRCCTPLQSELPPAVAALAHAQVQEALTIYKAAVRLDSTPASKEAATAQLRAALVRLEGEPLPEADCAAHRSLEALRLEDPAAMCGCWNPGCAACPAMAGCPRSF